MDMIKYIVKRLLLSVLILFGVSVIIYSLARMMPTDYVDNQYSSAVSQGTMRQEDVDRIKELYGLSMPDAYLRMKVGTGSSFAGDTFSKNTKQATYDEDVSLGLMTWKNLPAPAGGIIFYCWSASSFSTTARRTQTQSSAEAVSTSVRLG